MNDVWHILYRGPLSSCNYGCTYCPFAKTRNTAAELADDAARLARFVDWTAAQTRPLRILFTPWGEALIHRSYQEALAQLSLMPQVLRAAIQTNLSCRLDWTDRCDLTRLALWTTWHPEEVSMERFLEKCREARSRGVHFSVGIVGRREAFTDIHRLREALPPEIYLWINAWKRELDYYTAEEIAMLTAVDPHFRWNLTPQPSLGRACRSGHTAFTVDGDGNARRCHFIPSVIGNIYEPDFPAQLAPTPCSNKECRCHIGYVHMPELNLYELYGAGVMERIPEGWGEGVNMDGLAVAKARLMELESGAVIASDGPEFLKRLREGTARRAGM